MEANEFEIAVDIAKKAHQGQKDKAGGEYIRHPMTVAAAVPEECRVIAILHDVLEDSAITEDELLKAGISKENVEAVRCLTKPEDMDYFTYIRRVKDNALAKMVKLADLTHNMDLSRIQNPGEADFKRVKKYKKAMELLEE